MPWDNYALMRQPGRAGRGIHPTPVRPFFLLTIVVLFAAAGCRAHNKQYDLIEAELRTRNRELAEARAELETARLTGGAYQRPGECGGPVAGPGPSPAAEARGPAAPLAVKDIRLGAGTGGLDVDGRPGDELLQVVVVPADEDGSAVKVPGRLTVAAFEISPEGMKTPIGLWNVPPETLRKHWKSGLITTGYFLILQWDKPPTTTRIRVVVRLTTSDGRSFETDKDVAVTPLPGNAPRPGGIEELPPPAIIPDNPKKGATLLPAKPA
jgi:hypothetical protein